MKKEFFIITANLKYGQSLKAKFPVDLYNACVLDSFQSIKNINPLTTCFAVVDIDTFVPDLLEIRQLKEHLPNLILLAVSERNFHPEYKDVLGTFFFACLSKPIDINELFYLIKGL